MTKPIVNNKIIYQNIYGRVAQFGSFLNQGVRNDDSPTFANLRLSGDATIEGNLYVEGNTTILGTNIIEFEDNILLLNSSETGNGVTLNQAGLEIDRGGLENYRIIFNESDDTFRVGLISNTQAVATREDSPLSNGIMMWNDTSKRLDSRTSISVDLNISTTKNSISTTSGCLYMSGGLGVTKDVTIGGQISLVGSNNSNKSIIVTDSTTNSLKLTSNNNIELTPTNFVKIPHDKRVIFGTTDQSISSESLNSNLNIQAAGDINFSLTNGKRISIPNLIPITFSTANEKIYTDGFNNMVITGQQDIQLNPGVNKKILVPVDISLAFSNSTQKIFASLTNDLSIAAANHIILTPGQNKDVRIPIDNNLKFGATGNQIIYANSSNELTIKAASDMYITPTTGAKLILPTSSALTFGVNPSYIIGKTNGNLEISAMNNVNIISKLNILDTTDSSNYSNGALVINGGIGVAKNMNVNGNVSINGDLTVSGTTTTINTETILVEDNLFVINSGPSGLSDGGLLVKRYISGTSGSTNYAGLFFKNSTNKYTFAYTNTDPGYSDVVITDYISIKAAELELSSTRDSIDLNSGSIYTPGGASINKTLRVGTGLYTGFINATSSSNITSLSSTNIDTTNLTTGILLMSGQLVNTWTSDALSTTMASAIFNGGVGIVRSLYAGGNIRFTSTSDNSVIMSGGVIISNTNNAIGLGSGGALTVNGGTSINGKLYIGENININSTIISNSISSGALVIQGGIAINNTTNSESITNGGAMTINGGIGIAKDVYIGGNITINGSITTGSLDVIGSGNIDTGLTTGCLHVTGSSILKGEVTVGALLVTGESHLRMGVTTGSLYSTTGIYISYNTGIYVPGYTNTRLLETTFNNNQDQVNIYTPGNNSTTCKVTIQHDGNIGINTTKPNASLDINSSNTFGQLYLGNAIQNRKLVLWDGNSNDHQWIGLGVNNNTLRFQLNHISDNYRFYVATSATSSNELMCIQGNGNVGIGTMNPGFKLDVNGSGRFSTGLTVGSLYVNGAFGLDTLTTGSLYVTGGCIFDGNVGIGVDSAGAKLDVRAISEGLGALVTQFGGSDSPRILFYDETATLGPKIYFDAGNTGIIQSFGDMALLPDANIGIKTTDPQYTLDVNGTMNVVQGVTVGSLKVVGTSTMNNVYISGDIYVAGTLSPSIAFSNTQNCSIVTYGNNTIQTISDKAVCAFYVEVTPIVASENCQFEFTLPGRISDFTHRGQLIASCNGYTDDTNVIPLFNVLCVGSKNTPRGLIKFQSVSTSVHYLTVICRYIVI